MDNEISRSAHNAALKVKTKEELLTITASSTIDTVAELIPAGAIVLGVGVFVKELIPTAATFTVKGKDSSTEFNEGTNVAVAKGTRNRGTKNCPYYSAAAEKVRITPNTTPGTGGKVRIAVTYLDLSAPNR